MSLQTHWKKVDQRYSALKLRERKLVSIGLCVVVGLLAYRFALDPILQQSLSLQQSLKTQQAELLALQAQNAELNGQLIDPDADNRKALASLNENMSKLDQELKTFDALIVPPERMPRLLQSVLKKHPGLEVVSLKTLPVAPFILPDHKAEPTPKPAVPAEAVLPKKVSPLPPGGMYRHQMEVTVAGSYSDLLAYAEELQRISPRPLWSEMRLKVVEYPRSQLIFILYTLSLDSQWLAV